MEGGECVKLMEEHQSTKPGIILWLLCSLPLPRSLMCWCSGSAADGNKSAKRPPLPPAGVRRRMERNRQKLVGRDKGSLTEQQTEGRVTTTIQKRGIHKTNQQNRARRTDPLSRTEPLLCPPELRVSSCLPAPPHRNPAWRHIVCRLCLARLGLGQSTGLCPSWILLKINPVLAKPRTVEYLACSCTL